MDDDQIKIIAKALRQLSDETDCYPEEVIECLVGTAFDDEEAGLLKRVMETMK